MGPQNPPGYGPPPAGGYGGGYGPPGFGGPPGGSGGPPGGFGGPPPGFGAGGGGDRMAAEGKIKPAAITMLIFTVIGMLFQLLGLGMHVLGTGMNLANNEGGSDAAAQLMSGVGGIVINVCGLLAGGFCIYAFLKMMKLQGRGMAYTAIIFSMVPCLGSCCWVNMFVGIWALVAMSDENVKASFT